MPSLERNGTVAHVRELNLDGREITFYKWLPGFGYPGNHFDVIQCIERCLVQKSWCKNAESRSEDVVFI